MIKIIDDFLSNEDWQVCLTHFKGQNWCYPPLSGQANKTLVWRIFNPLIESEIGNLLYQRLSEEDIHPLSMKRVGINGSTMMNDSHIHVDGQKGDLSLVWFASTEWNKELGGNLHIYNDEEVWKTPDLTKKPNLSLGSQIVEYKPNRAVLFPAHLAHVPDSPNIKNILRISVGLHLVMADSWNYKYVPRIVN